MVLEYTFAESLEQHFPDYLIIGVPAVQAVYILAFRRDTQPGDFIAGFLCNYGRNGYPFEVAAGIHPALKYEHAVLFHVPDYVVQLHFQPEGFKVHIIYQLFFKA